MTARPRLGPARVIHGAMLAIVTLLFVARPATAQMLPIVPEPVTTPELMTYADLLELSDDQRIGLLSLHDDYRERYRAFQNGDLRRYQEEVIDTFRELVRSQFQIPERKVFEDMISGYNRLRRKTSQIDESLFSAMSGSLSETQLAALPRARTWRELERYRVTSQIFTRQLNRGAIVDLTSFVMELDRSPEEIELTRPILIEYEAARLRSTKAVDDALQDGAKTILDVIDDLGVRDMTTEEMMELAQDDSLQTRLMATWDEKSKQLQRRAAAASTLNLRTYQRLLPNLSEENARLLRERFFESGYSDVARYDQAWQSRLSSALEVPGMDAERRATISAQLAQLEEEDIREIEAMMEAVERVRAYRTAAQLSGEEDHPDEHRVDDLIERRRDRADRADASLKSLLGAELTARLEQVETEKQEAEQAAWAEANEERSERRRGRRRDGGPWGLGNEREVPDPLDPDALDRLLVSLAWSDDQIAVIEAVYEDYLDAYDTQRAALDAAPDADTPPNDDRNDDGDENRDDESSGDDEPSPRDLARKYRETVTALRETDASFFGDLRALAAAASDEVVIDRAEDERSRVISTWITSDVGQSFGLDEAYVDIASLVSEDERLASVLGDLATDLTEYETALTPIMERRVDAALESYSRYAVLQTLWSREDTGGDRIVEAVQGKWEEAQGEVRQANLDIVDLNRMYLDRMLNAVPDSGKWDLRYAYNQAAFPDLFDDLDETERLFQRTREQLDLSTNQASRIEEILMEYRSRYYDLSDRMVDLRRLRDWDVTRMEVPETEQINRELELERLRIDREDVDDRARIRLGLVLRDEQIEMLPELVKKRRER